MPWAPPKPCTFPCCGKINCTVHAPDWRKKEGQRLTDARRGSAAERGYGTEWRRLRDTFIASHPICADPFQIHQGRPSPAGVVDHLKPHKGPGDPLLLDWKNLESLCAGCHNKKTAQADGGFGNPKSQNWR